MTLRLAVLCLLLLTLPPAQAHGYVVRAIPADRAVLPRPPTRLQYWFSEALEPRFSELNLRNQSGGIIAVGGVDENSPSLLSLRAPPDLPPGAYIVELRPAFASDGHVVAESRVFFVGEEVGGITGQAADGRAIPLETLWRSLLGAANSLFFGAALLYSLVLRPAWGNPKYPAGGLPPRVMRRLRSSLLAAVALALAANGIALVQQSMAFFSADALSVIQRNLWQVVQIGSRFGDVWTFRMVLLVFTAILIFAAEYYRGMMPQLTDGIWKGMPWLGALLIGSTMVTSHAAGSLLLPWLALAVHWLHALAAAFWLGGIMTLALTLPTALRPYAGDARRQALAAVMARFSRLVAPMVMIVILTGAYSAMNWFVSPADIATSYGGSLGLKLIMVTLLLLTGGLHHLSLRPRLAERLLSLGGRKLVTAAFRLGIWLRLEVILALLVLLTAAWLSATPIPQPQSLQNQIDAPQATQKLDSYAITSAVIPGGPGVNAYDIVLNRADAPLTDARVYLQMMNPKRARRGEWTLAEPLENGLYAAVGDEIDAAETWWMLIDIVDEDSVATRAAFVWDIAEAASVQQSRPPQFIHLLLLLLIFAALCLWAYPTARRALVGLRITPASGLVALAAVAAATAVMGFGAAFISQRQTAYERTLNPPPAPMNAVLPDADSLRRGEALYRERCLVWQGHSADFRALRAQLDDARDDLLYAAVADGWRDLPACGAALSARQRWDIVNYFRTFAARPSA